MEKDRLKYLLENYVDGGLSGPELTELEAWYHQLNYVIVLDKVFAEAKTG